MSSQGSINIVNSNGRYRGRGRVSTTEAKTKGMDSSVGTQTPSNESSATSTRSSSSRSSRDTNGNQDVSLQKFTELLEKVKEYANIPDAQLPHHVRQTTSGIIHIVNLTPEEDRGGLLNHAQKVLGLEKLENIKPFSLNARLFGCRVATCHGIDIGCNILCAGSVGADPNTTGWNQCESTVLSYDENGFTTATIGTTSSENALVFVKPDFRGFHPAHVKDFKERGYKNVRIVQYDQSSNDCTQASPNFLAIEKFILKPRTNNNNNNNNNGGSSAVTQDVGMSLTTILIILFVLVAVMVATYFFLRKGKSAVVENEMILNALPPNNNHSEVVSSGFSGMTPRFPFSSMKPQ
jgi:hypothetical protein